MTWAKQHGEKIDATINDMEERSALLDSLMNWLKNAENTLDIRNDQPMPPELNEIEKYVFPTVFYSAAFFTLLLRNGNVLHATSSQLKVGLVQNFSVINCPLFSRIVYVPHPCTRLIKFLRGHGHGDQHVPLR